MNRQLFLALLLLLPLRAASRKRPVSRPTPPSVEGQYVVAAPAGA